MRALGVVVAKIFDDLFPVETQIPGNTSQTLVLNRAIEALQVAVVGRCPNATVSVRDAPYKHTLREAPRELRAMIRLQREEVKRELFERSLQETHAARRVST